jgi:hypothetical protein
VALALITFSWWRERAAREAQSLRYTITDGTSEVGDRGALMRSSHAPASVTFSDGSQFVLGPESAGRVLGTSARGGQVRLDEGSATVRVTHAPGARWSVEAGPFLVAVTGTSFEVAWSPPRRLLSLVLRTGSVIVDGPLVDHIAVVAGQRLDADLANARVSLSLIRDQLSAAAPDAPAPVDRAPPAVQRTPRTARRTTEPSKLLQPSQWQAALATGRFDDVVASAQSIGVERVIEREPAAALLALGDAARYTRHDATAEASFAAIARRFPSAAEADRAEFFVAWTYERMDRADEALAGYDRYLTTHPSGAYAEKAAGRAMLVAAKLTDREAAAARAQRYLRRFPNGGYATAARNLAQGR